MYVSCSPYPSYFHQAIPNSLQFADWSTRSPISRQMFAEQSQNNQLLVAKFHIAVYLCISSIVGTKLILS